MLLGTACRSYAIRVQGMLAPNSAHWHLSKQQKRSVAKLEFSGFSQQKLPPDRLPAEGTHLTQW